MSELSKTIESIRKDFPLISGSNIAYLDNAATTQKPQAVLDAVNKYYQEMNANPFRGVYELSEIATESYENARKAVAQFIGAKDASQIVFTRNATESLNLIAYSYGMNFIKEGDEIVVSVMEHHSNFLPWKQVAEKCGAVLKQLTPDENGKITDKSLEVITDKTKLVAVSQVSNVLGRVNDIKHIAEVAHAHGVPLIVDNTFPTPVNCHPIEWGADIVTHSTTKYMDGHGAAVGGAIVDSGKFDWMAYADKYPGLCTPDESYHGITYAEKFGKEGSFITKCTSQLMRDLGSIQAPQNAFILNLGLESLHVRMPRHVENGQAVAEFLEQHPKVAYVNYPGLPSSKYYERAKKYMPDGGCGVVSFGLKGGREAASVFMQNLKLGAIETHVADARTCCLNPATSTHRQMNDEQLKEAGVPAELIRISLGLEDKEDLIADISAALDAIQ